MFKQLEEENRDLKEQNKHLEIKVGKEAVYKNFFHFFQKH